MKVELLQFGFYNCYLLTGANGSALVDTAMPSNRGGLTEKLKGKNIKLILLTHGHLDHAGNAAYIAKWLGIPIAMSEADYPLIQGAKMALNTEGFLAGAMKQFMKIIASVNKMEPFSPVFVKESDSLLDYGIEARIVSLPGHTKGSIGVMLDSGELISGDATSNVFYEDKAELIKSAGKIIQMRPKKIYPGHGEAQTIADVAKEFNIDHNE